MGYEQIQINAFAACFAVAFAHPTPGQVSSQPTLKRLEKCGVFISANQRQAAGRQEQAE
jgi:hypothetical protein